MATLMLGRVVIELQLTPSWWQNLMTARREQSAEIVGKVVALLWLQRWHITEIRMSPARIVACVLVPADDADLPALNTRAQAFVNQLEQLEAARPFARYEPRARP